MERIKICFGITKATGGGAQKYVRDLATSLSPERYEVSLVAGVPGELSRELAGQGAAVTILPSLGRDVNILKDLASLWQLWRYLRAGRPDVLHLNSPKMGLVGALAARLAGVKRIIYTSHGWPYNEQRPWLVKLFFQILCWGIVWLCHEIIVISQSERTNERFRLIYNGVSEQALLPRAVARQELGLPSEALVVGTIAELHRNKGLTYLLSAAAALIRTHPQLHLAIIGEGEERQNLESLINHYQLANNIHLIGAKPEAARLLPAYDIFVLPSVKEGLPYVLLEAGLAGLPAVATRVGGVAEIIADKQSGLIIDPANPQAISEAIEDLIQNPAQRKTFGDRLREKVQKDFSLEQMISETSKLYQ